MRILLFPASYSPVVGGLQTVVQTLAKHLKHQGHEVRVITNRYPRSLPASEKIDGMQVDRLLLMRPQIDQLRRNRADLFLGSLYYGPDSYRRLRKVFKEFRPDVVNVHFPDHQMPFVMELRKRFEFKLVVSLHGHDVERSFKHTNRSNGGGAELNEFATALRATLKEADAVTAVSHHLLNRASIIEPTITNKSRVIHNGVDIATFQRAVVHPHVKPYVLGVGRLTYAKGFDLLLEAYAEAASGKDVDLIIAGDGEEQESLKNQALRLGLNEKVHFFGQATNEQVVELLNGCLCAAVPSRSEGFGIVALEAVAAGKPLVATEVGGLTEFLRPLANADGNGNEANRPEITLVKPTVDGMTLGLKRFLQSPSNGRAARQTWPFPTEFTAQESGANYEHVFAS